MRCALSEGKSYRDNEETATHALQPLKAPEARQVYSNIDLLHIKSPGRATGV